ncbi:MAG TPA: ATP-binding protein, partial [Edaphobacter sp.]|nr:ATP-binding protein [Edaphobacter sp.]
MIYSHRSSKSQQLQSLQDDEFHGIERKTNSSPERRFGSGPPCRSFPHCCKERSGSHGRSGWSRQQLPNRIEVELEYAARRFRMVVRDDGCGIDAQVLRVGHWGLPGMRERAERIGARLRVWSRPAAGTEVVLSLPNSIAFQSRTV